MRARERRPAGYLDAPQKPLSPAKVRAQMAGRRVNPASKPGAALAAIVAALEDAGWSDVVALPPARARARPVLIIEAGVTRDTPMGPRTQVKRLTVPRYEKPQDIVEAFAQRFGAPRAATALED